MIWLFILSALLNYASAGRYGLELGDLFLGPSASKHGVKGIVSVVNDNTFYIRNFTYDGKAPAAHFWVGKTPEPSPNGFLVLDELGIDQPLKEYQDRNIVISLPQKLKITDIKWLSIWCTDYNVDFGHILIPDGFDVPKPKEVSSSIPGRAHKVKSGSVVLVDSKTIKINSLYYDGNGPDAFFLVGTEGRPNRNGIKVPDENGKLTRLHGYNGENIVLRLPDDYTWFDLKWFSLYCIMAAQNFGEVYINQPLYIPIDLSDLRQKEMTKPVLTNCREIFPDQLLVRWLVEGENIYIELEGRANDNEYLSFGVSGSEDRSDMVGADVVVAFYSEPKYSIVVEDYHLTAKSQCSGGIGACPDVIQGGRSNVEVVHWRKENGIHSVIYKRRLEAAEAIDKGIYTNKSTTVVAAIGPMNSKMEAAKHTMVTRDLIKIDFGKGAKNCESLNVKTDPESKVQPWPPFKISDQRIFNAQIGPTGTDRGYTPITGLVGWGIAWWINGLLIPEITVKRGLNYTFIVEGGDDPAYQANYHPLYITNNKEGGGQYEKVGTPEHMVYAGLEIDDSGNASPVGVGRYCEYTHNTVDQSHNSETFDDFKKTLTLKCEDGNPGMFTWTPDKDTPDLVYYQCYTHRNLGWKIHVQNANGAEHLLVFRKWILAFVMCNVAVILCQA